MMSPRPPRIAPLYNPIWLTILPRERRARGAYQLCVMLLLLTVGWSQVIKGPTALSSLNYIPTGQAEMLAWCCVWAGGSGVASALIPERIIHVGRWQIDATWWRLVIEFAAHAMLIFVWAAWLVALLRTTPFLEGLGLGTGAALWLGVAAVVRCCQIGWTVKRALVDQPSPAGIISQGQARNDQ